MRDFTNTRSLLRRHCKMYGEEGIGARLLSIVDNSGTALDALCDRNAGKRRRRNVFGAFLVSPGRMLGANGACLQTAYPERTCDVFEDDISTESNEEFNVRVCLDPYIAFQSNRKRTPHSVFDEVRRRGIGAEATIWDIAAMLKFCKSTFPRKRFSVFSLLSYVSGGVRGDKYRSEEGRFFAGFSVDGPRAVLRGFHEDRWIDGPILIMSFADKTVDLNPGKRR